MQKRADTYDTELMVRLIEETRKRCGITRKQLTDGLCDPATLQKAMCGEKHGVDKLLVEAMMQRMGRNMAQYVSLLDVPEYDQFVLRNQIRQCLDRKDRTGARKRIEHCLQKRCGGNLLHRQMVLYLNTQLLAMEGADVAEQYRVAEEALRMTVPEFMLDGAEKFLYSEVELLLAFRLAFLKQQQGEKVLAVACYEGLRSLLGKECYRSGMQGPAFVPVLYHLAKHYYKVGDFLTAQQVCLEGLKQFRGKSRLLYFGELCQLYVYASLKLLVGIELEGQELEKMAKQMQPYRCYEALHLLLAEFRPEWDADTAYPLYREYNVLSVGMVIRQRRELHGWTRAEMLQDAEEENYSKRIRHNIQKNNAICDEDTLYRLETGQRKTTWDIEKALLRRVGLTPERYYTDFITDDYEINMEVNKIKKEMVQKHLEEVEEGLSLLKERDKYSDYGLNKQFMESMHHYLETSYHPLPSETNMEKMLQILDYTFPQEKLDKADTCYLFDEEMNLVRNIAYCKLEINGREDALLLLRKIEAGYLKSGEDEDVVLRDLIGIRIPLESELANIGNYKESNQMIEQALRDSLRHNFFVGVGRLLYSLAWNIREEKRIEHKDCPERAVCLKYLRESYVVSGILKDKKIMDGVVRHCEKYYMDSEILEGLR